MASMLFLNRFEHYTPSLRAFAFRLTQDRVEADDLFQETAWKALRNHHQYQERTNLKAWLMTIMRNTFINEWRRRGRRQRLENQELSVNVHPVKRVAENDGEWNLVMEEVLQQVDKLDAGFREPLLMAGRGYKYEEIADRMELPLGTVKSRIHQARKRLRNQIGDLS